MKRWFNVIRCCGTAVLSVAMLGLVACQKAETAGEATGEALEEAGEATMDAAQEAGEAIQDAADEVENEL